MVAAAFQLTMVLNVSADKDTKEKLVKVILSLTLILLWFITSGKFGKRAHHNSFVETNKLGVDRWSWKYYPISN